MKDEIVVDCQVAEVLAGIANTVKEIINLGYERERRG